MSVSDLRREETLRKHGVDLIRAFRKFALLHADSGPVTHALKARKHAVEIATLPAVMKDRKPVVPITHVETAYHAYPLLSRVIAPH